MRYPRYPHSYRGAQGMGGIAGTPMYGREIGGFGDKEREQLLADIKATETTQARRGRNREARGPQLTQGNMPPGWGGPFGDTVSVSAPRKIERSRSGGMQVSEDPDLMDMLRQMSMMSAQQSQGGVDLGNLPVLAGF